MNDGYNYYIYRLQINSLYFAPETSSDSLFDIY